MELFRPTGLVEMLLVLRKDLAGWPPRLPEQPIFYPVLNLGYAVQIARDWNTKADARVGYVTQFDVEEDHAARFDRRVVGGKQHEELWVPAEDLEEFNRHIQGPIRVVAAFFGEGFEGLRPDTGALAGRSAREQLAVLSDLLLASRARFDEEVRANREPVFLHLPFWESIGDSTASQVIPKGEVLAEVRRAWGEAFPELPISEGGS